MSNLDVWGCSKPGGDTRGNEDFLLLHPRAGVFVVADGIGGRAGGIQASATAASAFWQHLSGLSQAARMRSPSLRRAVALANDRVRSLGRTDAGLKGLGTTLSAAVVNGLAGKIVHVGDSRVYLLRSGRLRQLTADHTLVAELLAIQRLTPQQAEQHPMRNVLCRAIGPEETVEPDVYCVSLRAGDILILATDGLWKTLGSDGMGQIATVSGQMNAERLGGALIEAALARPPHDDATVAVIRIKEGSRS